MIDHNLSDHHRPGPGPARRGTLGCIGLLVVITAFSGGAAAPQGLEDTWVGTYDASLELSAGHVRFGIEVTRDERGLHAALRNGDGREPASSVEVEPDAITLRFDHYDGVLHLVNKGRPAPSGELSGTYRYRRKDGWASYPVRAVLPPMDALLGGLAPIIESGRWTLRFESATDPALLDLDVTPVGDAATVLATIQTTTGDYRYLHGTCAGRELRLYTFDAGHAFLFEAELQPDGSLRGDFWSGNHWHETWTARPDPAAALPDAFTLTRVADAAALPTLAFPDLDGESVSLGDERFAGKPRLIYLFGSWCPNCHDAGDLVAELAREYAPRGLVVIGLAFELTGDAGRDARQVRRYAARHGSDYPLLLAGVADKARAGRAFPVVDQVRAFPTFLFVERSGAVAAVYSGFSGPATGGHADLRRRFRGLVERLLE